MEFRILGPLEVHGETGAIALSAGKPRAILALLLLRRNEPVSAEQLVLALWGNDAPPSVVKRLHVHVSRLRRALGDPGALTTTPAGYQLRVRPDELDAESFARLADEGRAALAAGGPERADELLRRALELWRGPALADVALEAFAQPEIARLEEQRLGALEARVAADLDLGRHAELVAELRRLVAEQPWRERLHAQLMLALYRSGRQADALDAYRQARQTLIEQLGLEPSGELRRLEQAVLDHDPALTSHRPRGNGASAHTPKHAPARVPPPPSETVGRKTELRALRAAIGDPAVRLVTVVGPPGVGKTRLAIELARDLAPELRDGAAFVSLAAVDSFEHVASAIARELDVTLFPRESTEDALARELGTRQQLLVLDNFEHVLDAAPLVADLLAAAENVVAVATSREPLRVRAERLFKLDPLPLPDGPIGDDGREADSIAAVALFSAVARARDPGLTLTQHDAPDIIEMCRRLDGLPLAIELAAGSLGLLSVSELADRLGHGIDTLGTGARDLPPRQRTLTATLQWSYRLLDPDEQHTLESLAVFAGGCTIEAARFVSQASLVTIEALAAKNLILARRLADGTIRLGMLETVRDFARARLGNRADLAALHERHCEHYISLAERMQPAIRRSEPPELLAELDLELNNARTAIRWALSHPAPALALRLAAALAEYTERRRMEREAASWLETALALGGPDVSAALRATALAAYARSLGQEGTLERAEAAARESLALRQLIGDRAGCASSMIALSWVLIDTQHHDEDAYRWASEAERLAREIGDEQTRFDALCAMASCAPTLEQAVMLGDQAAATARARGHRRRLAHIQSDLTYNAVIHGDPARAQQLGDQAVATAEALGDPVVLAYALGNAGTAAVLHGDAEGARQAFGRQLILLEQNRYYKILGEPIIGLAAVAAVRGGDALAATLHGAADAAPDLGPHPFVMIQLDERCFAPARARLGQQAWQLAYAAGTTLDRERTIDIALGSLNPITAV
jgi:predicted ATPase/DNA-binding SARP family transcriptional activator